MAKTLDPVVCIDAFQTGGLAELVLLDVAAIQIRRNVTRAKAIEFSPIGHEVRDGWKTATASCSTVIRDDCVCRTVGLKDGYVLPSWTAGDWHTCSIAIRTAVALVVRSRDTGKSSNLGCGNRVAGKDVSSKASAIGLASREDLGAVNAVRSGETLDHIQCEANVVSLGIWIALPLSVETVGIYSQHIRVKALIRELRQAFLLSAGLGVAMKREDEASRRIDTVRCRDVKQEAPSGA